MTSEIAVMNQRAVALAADSAVTLIDGGTVVVRNDQRKLYNLVGGLPVGVMFFGVADMMGHPWEHLIEHYQKTAKAGARPHIRDYATSFVGMLDNLEEFFPKDRQRDEYKRLLASVFRYIFHLAQYLRDSGGDERQGVGDTVILEEAIERVWRDYQFRDDGSARGDLACFPAGFAETVRRNYTAETDELIAYGFQPFGLGKPAVQHLKEIAVYCVVKDLFLEDVTGLVFAGFGSEERYPRRHPPVSSRPSSAASSSAPRPRSTRSTATPAPKSASSPTARSPTPSSAASISTWSAGSTARSTC
ncbi:MAG: hypothetical protein WDN08_17840 [Rhizomicrobium sp.]